MRVGIRIGYNPKIWERSETTPTSSNSGERKIKSLTRGKTTFDRRPKHLRLRWKKNYKTGKRECTSAYVTGGGNSEGCPASNVKMGGEFSGRESTEARRKPRGGAAVTCQSRTKLLVCQNGGPALSRRHHRPKKTNPE